MNVVNVRKQRERGRDSGGSRGTLGVDGPVLGGPWQHVSTIGDAPHSLKNEGDKLIGEAFIVVESWLMDHQNSASNKCALRLALLWLRPGGSAPFLPDLGLWEMRSGGLTRTPSRAVASCSECS